MTRNFAIAVVLVALLCVLHSPAHAVLTQWSNIAGGKGFASGPGFRFAEQLGCNPARNPAFAMDQRLGVAAQCR